MAFPIRGQDCWLGQQSTWKLSLSCVPSLKWFLSWFHLRGQENKEERPSFIFHGSNHNTKAIAELLIFSGNTEKLSLAKYMVLLWCSDRRHVWNLGVSKVQREDLSRWYWPYERPSGSLFQPRNRQLHTQNIRKDGLRLSPSSCWTRSPCRRQKLWGVLFSDAGP